jgi:ABC-type branched-subunit amino acid transport system substrate-binding protein
MSLNGSFKETPFADLLQLFGISRQTASLSVWRHDGSGPADGVFWFDAGDLVGATMDGKEGREAVRLALRLHAGRFQVGPGGTPPPGATRAELRHIVMEETVNLDEESFATVSGEHPLPATPVKAPVAAPATGPAPAARPPRPAVAPPVVSSASRSRPPPPRRLPSALIAGLVIGLAVVGAILWFALSRGAGQQAESQAAPAVAVRGVTAAEIKLGMASAFTGANKERGRAMRVGWETSIAAANAAGGIHGRKLKLVTADDGYDPARTLAAMKQVVESDGVFAVVGNVGTATAAVSVQYVGEQRLVFFGPLTGGEAVRKTPPDRYVFNYRASLAQEAVAAVRYLVDTKRIAADKIGLLVQKDDFGEAGWKGAVAQLETYGVAAASVPRMEYARNTADMRDALDRLKEKGAAVQAMVLVATYKPAATFIRKARDAGHEFPFVVLSTDPSALGQELTESGGKATESVVLTQVIPLPASKAGGVTRYRQQLEQFSPGEAPGGTSLEGWIGAQVFLEALRKAGPALDTERLVAALESLQGLDLGTGAVMGFDPQHHQACNKVWGWALQADGTYQQIELE